jgi:hypothetical protein
MNREVDMNAQRDLLLLVMLTAVTPALGQQVGQAANGKHNVSSVPNASSIPDLSGAWRNGGLPWFEPPASGPGPVTNRSRRDGVSNYDQLVGDYTNPILQPWAAEVVKKYGEISLAGITYPNPANQCWPEPVPFIFKHGAIQVLQQPRQVTILYNENHEVRHIRLNEPHPPHVTPSWHGDSVGHYEGDTLVVDTVANKTDRPFAMIDLFGTPYTDKLHVVERYRVLDHDAVKDALDRGARENMRNRGPLDRDYTGKYLQVHLTIEDNGAFTTPWTATVTYARDPGDWREIVCAENRHEYYNNKDSAVPRADKPDF